MGPQARGRLGVGMVEANDPEMGDDLVAYRGQEPILARATRKLLESMPRRLRDACLGDVSLQMYMDGAAEAFAKGDNHSCSLSGKTAGPLDRVCGEEHKDDVGNTVQCSIMSGREEAWWCLKAAEMIVNMEGRGKEYRPRIRQLRRGVHTAPMTVNEMSLRGTRRVPVYQDKQFTTSFFRCDSECKRGVRYGVRAAPEDLVHAKFCPFCGAEAKFHVITLEEQVIGNGQ